MYYVNFFYIVVKKVYILWVTYVDIGVLNVQRHLWK